MFPRAQSLSQNSPPWIVHPRRGTYTVAQGRPVRILENNPSAWERIQIDVYKMYIYYEHWWGSGNLVHSHSHVHEMNSPGFDSRLAQWLFFRHKHGQRDDALFLKHQSIEISSLASMLNIYYRKVHRFNVLIELSVHQHKCWQADSIERIFEVREEASSEFTFLG